MSVYDGDETQSFRNIVVMSCLELTSGVSMSHLSTQRSATLSRMIVLYNLPHITRDGTILIELTNLAGTKSDNLIKAQRYEGEICDW